MTDPFAAQPGDLPDRRPENQPDNQADGQPESPFGDMAGGFDLGSMLEQAQQMQAQLVAAQEELARATVEGTAGGVSVSLNGTGELTEVRLDGAGDVALEDLGDLVVAAFRDAKVRTDELAQQTLGPLAGGFAP